MKAGPFFTIVAETFGLDPKAVAFAARTLREAGYLTTGARGVNAPHMTASDGARLALALLTGEGPANLVNTFEFYRSLTLDAESSHEPHGILTIAALPDNHTLEDLLTWVFSLWESPEQLDPFTFEIMGQIMEPIFSVTLLESSRQVKFSVKSKEGAFEYFYRDIAGIREMAALGNKFREAMDRRDFETARVFQVREHELMERALTGTGGIRVTREIATPEIAPIARALAERD